MYGGAILGLGSTVTETVYALNRCGIWSDNDLYNDWAWISDDTCSPYLTIIYIISVI